MVIEQSCSFARHTGNTFWACVYLEVIDSTRKTKNEYKKLRERERESGRERERERERESERG